jgi:hypothetical protein
MYIWILEIISYTSGFFGTVLIYFFGIPRKLDLDGGMAIIARVADDSKEKREIKKYKFWGNVGLALVAISFLIQLMLSICKYL